MWYNETEIKHRYERTHLLIDIGLFNEIDSVGLAEKSQENALDPGGPQLQGR